MKRNIVLIVVILLIVGAIAYLNAQKVKPSRSGEASSEIPVSPQIFENAAAPVESADTLGQSPEAISEASNGPATTAANRIKAKASQYDRAKEVTTPDGFINTAGVKISDLVGAKVILVDFWTYSCINCQRTTPYLNAWYEKYRDQGLEIIGLHTPEFEFEKKYENVQKAVEQFNIKYPVVLDNDYSTWFAYQNRYWPRKYLIDIDGFIIYDHIGEGGYAETERKIQEALKERLAVLGEQGAVASDVAVPENAENVDFTKPRSPEIYFGSRRNSDLGNGQPATEPQSFVLPAEPKTNILYLEGEWKFTDEYAENISGKSKIVFRYQGQKVFMVASGDEEIQVTVTLDGQPLSDAGARGQDVISGERVDFLGVKDERLYRIIEAPVWGEHTLELQIESPGLRVFTLTFG